MNDQGHCLTIDGAARVLEKAGHPIFAALVRNAGLPAGAVYADKAGRDIDIVFTMEYLCGAADTELYRKTMWNEASNEHYYNPRTGTGLDITEGSFLETLAQFILFTVDLGIVFTAGMVYPSVRLDPEPNFSSPYPSAVQRCAEHYERAIDLWKGSAQLGEYGIRCGRQGEAWFELGWACHFLADLCISTHTCSKLTDLWGAADPGCLSIEEFIEHNDYEAFITDRMNASLQDYVESAAAKVDHGFFNSAVALPVRELAKRVATETASEHDLFLLGMQSESMQDSAWNTAAAYAIPRALANTAILIAKFMLEIGTSETIHPLQVTVVDAETEAKSIAGAYLFYRPVEDGKPADWTAVVCDANGRVSLDTRYNHSYHLRPAMPGYIFEGRHFGDYGGSTEFPTNASPVEYVGGVNPSAPNLPPYMSLALRKV